MRRLRAMGIRDRPNNHHVDRGHRAASRCYANRGVFHRVRGKRYAKKARSLNRRKEF
jgi:hypothetical protein